MVKISEFIKILLLKRGITEEKEIEKFLNPDYQKDLHDPFLLPDMEKACVRLFNAIEAQEKIIIYADYDSDGIPGAVIFDDLFQKINFKNYEVYIPMRNSEGYGLNLSAIEEFKQKDVKLIITVDLGISAIQEVAQAEVNLIDVIITDHHLPLHSVDEEGLVSLRLPKAYAILNPKVENFSKNAINYPEKMLCGAGVVFKFMQAFLKKYAEFYKIHNGWEKWLLDMVGLATLADLVPLTGENRTLASFGIKVLRKSRRLGLVKLLAQMKIEQKYLTEDDITFMVAPRLNAASRMADPKKAFELLVTRDLFSASELSKYLSKINDDRKLLVAGIMREVKKIFEKREIEEIIVIGNPKWRIGILGLVAGKISDLYKKTVFVWGKDENNIIKGSCRSSGEISVVEIMSKNKECFIDFGGHELAGGFSVFHEKIHLLQDVLIDSYKKHFLNNNLKDIVSPINFDLSISFKEVNLKNYQEIEKLSPFGIGNPKPIFLFENVTIEKIRKFGKNNSQEHLEIIFCDLNNIKIKAISFFANVDSFETKIKEGLKVNLLATMELSRFGGKQELRLRIVDIL